MEWDYRCFPPSALAIRCTPFWSIFKVSLYKLANLCWVHAGGLQLTTGNMNCDWHLWYIVKEHSEELPCVVKRLCVVSLNLLSHIKQWIHALFLYTISLWSVINFHKIRCYSQPSDYMPPSDILWLKGITCPHKFSSSLKGFPGFWGFLHPINCHLNSVYLNFHLIWSFLSFFFSIAFSSGKPSAQPFTSCFLEST